MYSPLKALYQLIFILFIRPFVKVSLVPSPLPVDLESDEHKTCILVMPDHSYVDELVIRHALSHYPVKLYSLWLPKSTSKRANERFDKRLKKLQEEHPHAKLLPVSLFWGRMPGRQEGFWTSYLSDNWAVAGAFRRWLTVIMQIRNVFCYVGATIDSQSLSSSAGSSAAESQTVRQQLSQVFQGQREAIIGPDLSHQRILADKVLSSDEVRKAVAEFAQQNNKTKAQAEKKAQTYLKEMASDYSYPIVRLFDIFLSWLWEKIYQGVKIEGIENIQKVAEDCELIYVPCHRSHIDYMLLSYVIYHKGYMPPHIAAGINLNLPIVGTLLRRGGAFFIRRQFRDNKLYRAVLEAYVHIMCAEGFSIEYFIEGGRSRTGFLLQPKAGMLAMTLRAASRPAQQERPLAFVPVYIGYERLFESHSYINELYGEKKKKETIGGLLSARKYLKEDFGQVYLNIGEPIFPDTLRQAMIESGSNDPHNDADSFKEWVSDLGTNILEQINRHASITSLHYIAVALLGSPRNALLDGQLRRQMAFLDELAQLPNYKDSLNFDRQPEDEAIRHAMSLGLIKHNSQSKADIYYLDQSGEVSATFLRNNSLHVFILPSLIANILVTSGKVSWRRLRDICHRLYPYIKADLFLPWPQDQLEKVIEVCVKALDKQKLVDAGSLFIVPEAQDSEAYDDLIVLAGIGRAHFQRFNLVSQILLQAPEHTYQTDSLELRCVEAAQQLSILHEVHAPDFFDKNLFRTFIQNLVNDKLIELDASGNIRLTDALVEADKQANYVLSADVRRSITRVAQPTTL